MAVSGTSEAGLSVATVLYDFVINEALPGTGLDPAAFRTNRGDSARA